MTDEDIDVEEANALIEEAYAQLRADFRHSLPDKIDNLEKLVASLDTEKLEPETFDNVLMQLHRTKGTIGSYGFSELSRMVEAVETLMKQAHLPPNQQLSTSDLWQSIRKQVAEIFTQAKQEAHKLASGTANDA